MVSRVAWTPSYRLIAARLPRVDIFERLVAPDQLPALLAIEALTNPRLRPLIGPVAALSPKDRVTGPGAAYVMAPFAYPRASRFGDGSAGVYYAARELATAIAEVSYHRARFLAATHAPAMDLDERIVAAQIDVELADVRAVPMTDPLYAPDDYGASQAEARRLRTAGANGVVYRSVRQSGGECVALFHPRHVRNAQTSGYIGLRWNGSAITDAYTKASLTATYPG